MTDFLLKYGCLAGALALSGCGEPPPDAEAGRSNAQSAGVTIALEEPAPALAQPPVVEKEPTPPKEAVPPAEEKDADPPPEKSESEDATAVEAAPQEKADAPTSVQPARLPLPNEAIVRTLDRIGFACGSIISSTRVEAPEGQSAYRINCSSGDSYRASNRSGGYRFSKWDRDD